MTSGQVDSERARELHRETREELLRADGKATTLLSVSAVVIGAIVAGAIAGDWTPADLSLGPEIAFWFALLGIVSGAAEFLRAVMPRTKHDAGRESARYFGHVVQMAGRDELTGHLSDGGGTTDHYVDQIWVLAGTVNSKYQCIRTGLVLTGLGLTVAVVSLIVDSICA